MTTPKFIDRHITIGNIVSWALILLSFAVAFTKLQGDSAKTMDDVKELKRDRKMSASEINQIKIDVAVIKATVGNIDNKIDAMRRESKLAVSN